MPNQHSLVIACIRPIEESLALLKEFKHVFTYTYSKMHGLDATPFRRNSLWRKELNQLKLQEIFNRDANYR